MADKRHSTVQFNPTAWLAATARMPRIVRSLYFDLCVYTWEHAAPVPPSEVYLMISDLPEGQGAAIIANLEQSGTLMREGESIFSPEALEEATRALAVYEAKSRGGRGRTAQGEEEPQQPAVVPESADETPRRNASPFKPFPLPDSVDLSVAGAPEIATAWNAMARKNGYKQISKMTQERLDRLNVRIVEHGAQTIIDTIYRIPGLPGEGMNRTTFDDLLKPKPCAILVRAACGEAAGQVAGEDSG